MPSSLVLLAFLCKFLASRFVATLLRFLHLFCLDLCFLLLGFAPLLVYLLLALLMLLFPLQLAYFYLALPYLLITALILAHYMSTYFVWLKYMLFE